MPHKRGLLWLLLMLVTGIGLLCACTTVPVQREADAVEERIPLPSNQVRLAVIEVLTAGGYDVDEDNSRHMTTGYRREISGPWDWLLRWRFGVSRSRVAATITPEEDTSTRLNILVTHEGKDGLFVSWEESDTPLPQSAANQLRLIKNALHIL